MSDLLTTKQAAAILGVTPRQVQAWCQAGRLLAEARAEVRGKVWYIRAADLAMFQQQPRPVGNHSGRARTKGRAGE